MLFCHITQYHYSNNHRILHELICKMKVNKMFIVFYYIYSVVVDDDNGNNDNNDNSDNNCFSIIYPLLSQHIAYYKTSTKYT